MTYKRNIIVHIITALDNGGAEAVLYRLVTTDPSNNHIVISMMGMGKYGPMLKQAGVSVRCLDLPKGHLNLNGIWRLWKLIRQSKPDVVQTWMYHADLIGGILARFAGVKNVCWGIRNSTLETGLTSRTTILIAKICAMVSYIVPHKIITCAQKAMDVHIALGYCPHKFFIIPNGYNLNQFKPDHHGRQKLRSDWGINENETLLGMVARFNPQKDVDNLFQSLKIVSNSNSNFHCVLIGNGMGAANKELGDAISKYGLNSKVTLLGPQSNIPAIMSALDIHILSSRFGEAFPNVLAEAMACGTPCISTDVGDAKVIVGKTGWVVPSQSSKLLANAILEALEEKKEKLKWDLRQQECRNQIVDNFGIDLMVSNYHLIWGNNTKL